jgi:hypothetical protein
MEDKSNQLDLIKIKSMDSVRQCLENERTKHRWWENIFKNIANKGLLIKIDKKLNILTIENIFGGRYRGLNSGSCAC